MAAPLSSSAQCRLFPVTPPTRWRLESSRRSIARIQMQCRRFSTEAGASRVADSYRLDFQRLLQRDDRDFRRAVDPYWNVDRSDPAAHEHPRVVARAESR